MVWHPFIKGRILIGIRRVLPLAFSRRFCEIFYFKVFLRDDPLVSVGTSRRLGPLNFPLVVERYPELFQDLFSLESANNGSRGLFGYTVHEVSELLGHIHVFCLTEKK